MSNEALHIWITGSFLICAISIAPFLCPRGSAIRRCALLAAPMAFLLVLLSFPAIPFPRWSGSFEGYAVSPPVSFRFLLPIWLVGVALLAAARLPGLLSIHRARATSRPLPTNLRSRLADLNPADIPIRFTTASFAPAVCGVFQPIILVPLTAKNWSLPTWRMVLAHELAHVKNHDLLLRFLADFVCMISWMNPLGWLLARLCVLDCEHRCDHAVIAAGHSPKSYATTLLNLATGASPSLACAGMARRSFLETRVREILKPAQKSAWKWPSFIALILMACAMFFVASNAASPPDDKEIEIRLSADPFPNR